MRRDPTEDRTEPSRTSPDGDGPDRAGASDADAIRRALRDAPPGAPPRPGALRRLLRAVPALMTLAAATSGTFWLMTAPDTPLAPEWNPTVALDLAHPATPLTGFKLRRAAASREGCLAALSTGAAFEPLPPFQPGEACTIASRVRLRGVGDTRLPPVETSCETALRLAAWERFAVPAAAAALGSPVVGLTHQGSYNCRAIRGGTRLSSHATAGAVDVNGVVLADGRRVPLLGNWGGDGPEARFWRAARDGACDWFGTVLGPEFDANHADHLHLQSRGRGSCR